MGNLRLPLAVVWSQLRLQRLRPRLSLHLALAHALVRSTLTFRTGIAALALHAAGGVPKLDSGGEGLPQPPWLYQWRLACLLVLRGSQRGGASFDAQRLRGQSKAGVRRPGSSFGLRKPTFQDRRLASHPLAQRRLRLRRSPGHFEPRLWLLQLLVLALALPLVLALALALAVCLWLHAHCHPLSRGFGSGQ